MKQNVDWLFFDVGNTLVCEWEPDEERIRIVEKKLRELGRPMDFYALMHRMLDASRRFAPSPFYQTVEELGIEEWIGFNKPLEKPYPYAKEVLDQLSAQYHIGIIANQPAGTAQRLKEYGLDEHIEVCISSTEEGVSKPDPAIYCLGLERANCAPERAMMIGDRLDNDVFPAKSVGMKTLWVRQGWGAAQSAPSSGYEPDLSADSIFDLPAILL